MNKQTAQRTKNSLNITQVTTNLIQKHQRSQSIFLKPVALLNPTPSEEESNPHNNFNDVGHKTQFQKVNITDVNEGVYSNSRKRHIRVRSIDQNLLDMDLSKYTLIKKPQTNLYKDSLHRKDSMIS